jgi:hypothetical protein
VVLLPCALIFMWRIQRAVNDLDFADWFRGPNGRASWKEAQGMGGFVVGTWCMVYVTVTGKVPEGYVLLFLVYLAVCIGSPTAVSIIARMWPAGVPAPSQQVKVDAPADAIVSVKTGVDQTEVTTK